MDRQLISQWFDYVPMLYWPVLCLEIVKFHIWAWADAETLGYARQMIVAVNDRGRVRVRFIEDAPADASDWRSILSSLSTRRPGEGRDPSLALSHCMWAVSQSWTQAFAGEPTLRELTSTPPPILDPG